MKKLKKPVSILLTLTMIVSLFTIIPFEASAVEGQTVSYRSRYWDSKKVREVVNSQENVKPLSSCVDNTSLSGWYYTDKSFEVGSRVKVADSAYIILTKGKTVTFKKGIRVADGKELNIYPDDKSDNGKLIANADGYDAAIGSNDEDDGDEDKAGTVNIYGGTIEAKGGTDGAGIGGGNEAKGGTVNIYGGTIDADGGNYAAGIGGGDECSGGTVNIYGGTVYAWGGQDAAGIGGGEDGSGADYNQYGGSVRAHGGSVDSLSAGGGAGVGGGECGSQGGTVNINGGSLIAIGSLLGGAAGIGGGHDASGGTVNITGGTVQATAGWGAGIGGGEYHSNGTVNITGGTVKAESAYGAGIGSAFGKNNGQGGDILIENAKVTAIGKGYGAGIGGGGHELEGGSAKNITIRNSLVSAGSSFGAGIGGGGVRYGDDDGGHGGTVIIEGSSVFAISKERGAGIGGGCSGDGGSVTIKDSYVEAYGGSASYDYIKDTASYTRIKKAYKPGDVLSLYAAEYDAKVADVIVALILNDTWGGAGIGGGSNGRGANVKIEGKSTVIACGGAGGTVAIGHGLDNSENRTLTLSANLLVQTGNDFSDLQNAPFAYRASRCQKNQYAVITPCSHPYATYKGVYEGHAVDSCPDCGMTFDENYLEPHVFHSKYCTVCGYEGVVISFDSGGLGGKMNSVVQLSGEYTLPDKCDFSILYHDSKTYYLCGWNIEGTEYKLGETINVDHDITAVGIFARGNIDIIATQNGHVLTDVAAAPPGATVNLTAVPDFDCRLTSIKVTAAGEIIYESTAEEGGSLGLNHQFTMPDGASSVEVRSVFKKNEHKVLLDSESFSSLGAPSPVVLVNDFESDKASYGDTITVIVPTDSSVDSVAWFSVDSNGNKTENIGYAARGYIVGSDGKATLTMRVSSDIKIYATSGHYHDGYSFTAWGSGAGENTSLPTQRGTYYLTEDITLSEPWYLQSDVNICLNGHKITPATEMEYMIYVRSRQSLCIYDHDNTGAIDGLGKSALINLSNYATLTLYGGTLQNGFGGEAAGVYVGANNTFTMHGGVITGMQADLDSYYIRGAGVCVKGGKFVMDGGTITGNKDGSGVYVGNGRIELSGAPVINNNGNRNTHNGDVWLSWNNVISITGKLSSTARIGIKTAYPFTPDAPIVVTKGFSGNGELYNFYSTDRDMTLGLFNGELAFACKRTVSFDMNGGAPEREPETVALGCDYILPANAATKEKSVFTGWKIGDTDTVLPAGDMIYISDDVTLHAVWGTADEYAYIEDHVHRWEIKIDEEDISKVTVRCLDGDQCNEGVAKYAQLQINGNTGTYTTTYNGSSVTATVYKQPQKGTDLGFYDESLIHVSDVFYTDVMGEVMDSAPVDAGVYFANATISPASGKGEPATIRQMIVIERAQPDITVTGIEQNQTGEPLMLVNATDVTGKGTIFYRVNGGEWTTEPVAAEAGEYEIEWFFDSENYANVNSMESPGTVHSVIHYRHIHDGNEFVPWTGTDSLPTQSGYYFLTNDIVLNSDVTLDAEIQICLFDKTIDLNGHLLTVNNNKTLTLYAHDGGTVTGGGIDGSGIYIQLGATLTSHGVKFTEIKNNRTQFGNSYANAAISILNGTFNMDGGSVTNCSGQYGGVINYYGTFVITGAPVIKNNVDFSGKTSNVFLYSNPIRVGAGLTEEADIGVNVSENDLSQYIEYTVASDFAENCPDTTPSAIFSIDCVPDGMHLYLTLNYSGNAVIKNHEHIAGETVRENENASTCTEKGGYDEVTYCSVCGEEISRSHVEYELAPHTEEIIPGTPADCTHTGLTDGKKCSVCGEILEEQEIIPFTHQYGDAVWTWADDYSRASAKVTCMICQHEESAEATVTNEYISGRIVYTATVRLDGETYTDVREIDNVQYVDQVEPTVDDSGAYILGTKEHYVIGDKNYAVNSDNSVGGELADTSLSYFDFALRSDDTYQIRYYTGPAIDQRLVIPKTFNGKKVTVLGVDSNDTFYSKDKTQFELVLNENIREIKNRTFYVIYVTKVSGDTSGLRTIGDYAFSWANSLGGYTLDIRLDYPGKIMVGSSIFNNMNISAHLRHSTTLSSSSLGHQSITYDFTDEHLYQNAAPVWSWEEDNSGATATFTCSDSRCNHVETINATMTRERQDEHVYVVATVVLDGVTYTDRKEIDAYRVNNGIFEGGTVTADKAYAAAGEEVTLTATENPGYVFLEGDWNDVIVNDAQGNRISLTRQGDWGSYQYRFTMPESDVSVVSAKYYKQYYQFFRTVKNGTISLSIDRTTAQMGTEIEIILNPNEGYELESLSVVSRGGVPVAVTDNKFIMPGDDVYITVIFEKPSHTISYNDTDCGTVAGPVSAHKDGTVTLTVTPDEGYSVTSVTVNGAEITPKDGVYSFVMPNEDVTVSAAFGFADDIGARLLGHSLSLDGDIGVNFYMELSDSIANSDTAYMHFIIPAGDITTQTDVRVADAQKVEFGGKTYYVFKCQVAAKEMTSEITAQIIDGTREGTVYTYSVKEYADYLLAHTDNNAEYAKAAPLVKAMLNYGAYSQLNFDKNPGALANSDLTDAEKELGDISIDIADPVISNLPEGTSFEGASLSLKSETTLSLFFKSSETLTFSCDGYNVETVQSGGYQIARIRGIKAKHIGDILTLHVNGGTVQYSPLNYCKNVLNSADATPDEAQAQDGKLVNVVKALYLYWQAANRYFD